MDFDVTALPDPALPAIGEAPPSFTRPLVTIDGWKDTALEDVAPGEALLLVFHPMDGSFPATYIWKEISGRDWGDELHVVGCSPSTPYEHASFIRERGLEDYALFSDPGAVIAREYGIAHELDGMTGVTDARPAVILIDSTGLVQYTWGADEYPEFPPYDEIEAAIDDL